MPYSNSHGKKVAMEKRRLKRLEIFGPVYDPKKHGLPPTEDFKKGQEKQEVVESGFLRD